MTTTNDTDHPTTQAQVVRVEQALAALVCVVVALLAAAGFCAVWVTLTSMLDHLPLGR